MEEREIRRPEFPARAVITGGMPYGNKELHFGHVGGMFVHADTFARFMRDRIGRDNVVFVSGTDCYGSPIVENHRKIVESKKFSGSLLDFVTKNHNHQEETLKMYEIEPNLFGASALGRASEIHKEVSREIIETLYKNGAIKKMDSLQFFDKKHGCLLNGRQVIGKCPIEGCKSEKAYADECDLGHQYMPVDLIDPISTLSGETPELKKISNWYFKLDENIDLLNSWLDSIERKSDTRSYMVKEIREFFKKPEIYIKKDQMEKFEEVRFLLPSFTEKEERSQASMTIIFDKLTDRESACEILANAGIRYRTGKTLVPFRLTGDIEWGVPCPTFDGLSGQTFWVWPESLWAPISFTKTYLESKGFDENEWKKYWCSDDAEVYQFIGEDNMYFYGPAQQSIFLNLQGKHPVLHAPEGSPHVTNIVANKHILFLNKKASSSSDVKPPMARDLLSYYTAEQLRSHFLGLNLGNNNVSFMPKVLNKEANPNEVDPVLKEGNLYTNVFNRVLRTLFYTTQKEFDGVLPYGVVSESVLEEAKKSILQYERFMHDKKFHQVMNVLDVYIRNMNKYWSKTVRDADHETLRQLIVDTAYMARVATVLSHPVVPNGSENVAKYLGVNDKFFDWQYIFEDLYFFIDGDKENHKLRELKEKEDFFKKHPSQFDAE